MQTCIVSAARYQNIWDENYERPSFCNTPPARDCLSRVNTRIEAFMKADKILNDERVRAQIKRRITSPMVMAIVAETMHSMPLEAEAFWLSVSTNGEKIAGQVRDLMIEGKPPRSSTNYMPRLAAQAWNQRASQRSLRREQQNYQRLNDTDLTVPA